MHAVAYFAFGSNMSSERFLARIPDAVSVGKACLDGWRFTCDKRGSDGSAKANIVRHEGGLVWGVLYAIPTQELDSLDYIEGGYQRTLVEVLHKTELVECFTYASARRFEAPSGQEALPFDWYKQHIVVGAREFSLPSDYVAMLEDLPQRSPEI